MLNISNNIFTYSRLYINKQRTEDENNACKSFFGRFYQIVEVVHRDQLVQQIGLSLPCYLLHGR